MPTNVIRAEHKFAHRAKFKVRITKALKGAKFPCPTQGTLAILTALNDEERRLRILGLHEIANYMQDKANALLGSERLMQYGEQNPAPDRHHTTGKPSRRMAWFRGCALTEIGAEGIYDEIGIDPADIDRLERIHRAQVYQYLKDSDQLDPTGKHENLIEQLEYDGYNAQERNRTNQSWDHLYKMGNRPWKPHPETLRHPHFVYDPRRFQHWKHANPNTPHHSCKRRWLVRLYYSGIPNPIQNATACEPESNACKLVANWPVQGMSSQHERRV